MEGPEFLSPFQTPRAATPVNFSEPSDSENLGLKQTHSILLIAQTCRSQLKACTLLPRLKESQWAYDRLSDFNLWDSGIGASADGIDSLDHRFKEDEASRKVVVVALNALKALISLCQMLADETTTEAMNSDETLPQRMEGTDDITTDSMSLEQAKEGVEDLQTKLAELAVALRVLEAAPRPQKVSPYTQRIDVALPRQNPSNHMDLDLMSINPLAAVAAPGPTPVAPQQERPTALNIGMNTVNARIHTHVTRRGSGGSASYIFRINELRERSDFASVQDTNGQWVPTDARRANVNVSGGATNIFWLCDGKNISILENDSSLLSHLTPYKTYSVYYCHGKGFQVLRDNAVTTKREEGWLPLTFDHDKQDYSSYLTNARLEPALHCHRRDQKWMKMLLPDMYHDKWEVPEPYGGLKGELAIFLALIAFSIPMEGMKQYLPSMFHNGAWQQYEMANGRDHKRGVVVEVWSYPSRHGGSSVGDLVDLEEHGKYYA